MLALLLSLCLHLTAQDEVRPPAPERVAQVLADLKQSLKQGTQEQRIRLLTQASDVPSKEIAAVLAESLRNKDPKLVAAAIQGLRWMQHPAALTALHKAHGSNKNLLEDESHHLALLKAIGQHGSATSIKLLSHEPWSSKNAKFVEARIFGLGMIRDRAALEAIFAVMRNNPPASVANSMNSLRTSLMMLTGVDKGPKMEAWAKWWRESQADFKMAARSTAIPREIMDRWTRYWGLDYATRRVTKREDRGL